jgi:7-cyano-7-deazaguanine synthase
MQLAFLSRMFPRTRSFFLRISVGGGAGGDIFIGVNAVDYSGYPDCGEYIAAYERMANLATRMGVEGTLPKIHAIDL